MSTTETIDPFGEAAADPFGAPAGASTAAADGSEEDPFADPVKTVYPTIKGLLGRLVLLAPLRIERVPDDNGGMKDRMYTDVIVLDGPPVIEWANKHGEAQKVALGKVPSDVIPEMWIESIGIVRSVKPRLMTPNQPCALGRVALGAIPADKQKSRPYFLESPTAADKVLARPVAQAYLASRAAFASS